MNLWCDIDGILTIETEGHDYKKRTPNIKNIANLNQCKDRGDKVILWSSRFEVDRTVTIDWLKKHGVKYDKLILDKPQYDLLVDDKTKENFKWLK